MPEAPCLRKTAVCVRPRVINQPRDSKFSGNILTPLSIVQFAEVFFLWLVSPKTKIKTKILKWGFFAILFSSKVLIFLLFESFSTLIKISRNNG